MNAVENTAAPGPGPGTGHRIEMEAVADHTPSVQDRRSSQLQVPKPAQRSPSRSMSAVAAVVSAVSGDIEDIEIESESADELIAPRDEDHNITLQVDITAQNRRHPHRPEASASRVLEFTVDELAAIKNEVKDMTMVQEDSIPLEHEPFAPNDGAEHHDHHFAGMTANPLSRTDTVREITDILKSEPQERSRHEVDILVRYFQNLHIMDEDVGQWVGQVLL